MITPATAARRRIYRQTHKEHIAAYKQAWDKTHKNQRQAAIAMALAK